MMWWMPLPRDDELKTLIFQGQAALFPGAIVMFTPRLMTSLRVSLTQWLMFAGQDSLLVCGTIFKTRFGSGCYQLFKIQF